MKLGILETGPVADELSERYGTYTDVFNRMLQRVDPTLSTKGWTVYDGNLPQAPDEMDGWIISGSKYGAYEDLPWIPKLEIFLRDCMSQRVPMAGFCFGHQILAQAMGGTVVKSEKGWGLGVHDYKVEAKAGMMTPALDKFSAIAVHQDQVISPPKDAIVLASSDFCPIAALAYGDLENPIAISVQPHPEFDRDFSEDLFVARRGLVFPEDVVDTALEHLDGPINNDEWAQWVVAFFQKHQNVA